MRPIRFRVFNEYTGLIERVWGINYDTMGNINKIDTGFTLHIIGGDRDKFHLMQYTGLKDRNGVEIFEDYLVKDFHGKIYQVIYDGFMFNLEGYYDSSSDYPTIAFSEGVFEVIGNIHQNKSLLEEYDDKIEGLTD